MKKKESHWGMHKEGHIIVVYFSVWEVGDLIFPNVAST